VPVSDRVKRRHFSAEELEEWHRRIFSIYGQMSSASRPYEVSLCGMTIIVLPSVYAPGYFTDSAWFAAELPDIVGSASLLEIGCGTGVISLCCALRGAEVTATDVNPLAVENTRLNARQQRLSIEVLGGSVYEALPREHRFDIIFWAHPFNNCDWVVSDPLLLSGFDRHYDALRAYIQGAHEWLAPGGRLLLGTGDSADLATIEEVASACGFLLEPLRSATMPLSEEGEAEITYLLLELRPSRGALAEGVR